MDSRIEVKATKNLIIVNDYKKSWITLKKRNIVFSFLFEIKQVLIIYLSDNKHFLKQNAQTIVFLMM